MKSKYYCLARFSPADSLQVGNEFFVGSPLYFMSKLLGIFHLLHSTTRNIVVSKYLKLSVIFLLAFLIAPTVHAVQNTNVSILYGWNGTNFIPLLTDAGGRLQTDINITDSVGINPKTNGSYTLGTTQREWANIYAVSGTFSRNVSVGGWNSRQTLDVTGGNIALDIDKLLILNGSTTTEYLSFDAANLRMRFNVRDAAGYGFAFTNNSGTVLMQVNSSGFVSIGTAAPSSLVHVVGTNSANNLTLNVNNTLYVNNSGGGRVG